MKLFTIGTNDANQRLDKFLSKAVPNLPQALLYKSIRLKRIKVNGKRATISQRLSEGDAVSLYLQDEFFTRQDGLEFLHAPQKLRILYEDAHILVVDKPVGLLSHADDQEYLDTLITRILRYLYEKGEYDPQKENSFTPSLANRIDRNTGGIVLAAKTAEALRVLNQKIKDREIKKEYLCVVRGRLTPPEGLLHDWLLKDSATNTVQIYNTEKSGSKEILTRYRVLAEKENLSLLEVELLTGRTHQIRAHLAYYGHPLLGDGKYGSFAQNKAHGIKTQCLYSYKTTFAFQTNAGVLNYLNGKQCKADDVWFMNLFGAAK